MKKQKKFLAVLSAAAVSTMIAAAVSTTAFAKTTDVIAKIDGQEVKINFEELTTAYENKAAGLDSELFNKYNEREGLTALLDDKNGFVDYKAVQEAAEDAVALGEKFVLNDFTETTEKTLADFKPEAEWKDDKVVPVTPVEEDLKVESVSAINAKTLKVNFNNAIAKEDQAKVTFETKRGTINVSLTAKWAEDGKSAELVSSSNLIAGDYTVTAKGLEFKEASGTVKVEAIKSTGLEVKSTILNDETAKAKVNVSLKDQYGEEITLVQNDFTVTAFNVTQGKSATLVFDGTDKYFYIDTSANPADFKANDVVKVTFLHNKTGLQATADLKVVQGAYLDTITFGEVELPKDKNMLTADLKDVKVPFTAKDQFGNDKQVTNEDGTYTIVSSDTTILDPSKVTLVTEDKVTKVKIASFEKEGKVTLTMMSTASGKTASVVLDVQKAPGQIANVAVLDPEVTVAAGSTGYVGLEVTDMYGEKLEAKDYAALEMVSSNPGVVVTDGNLKVETTGDNIGKAKVQVVAGAKKDATATIAINHNGKQIASFVVKAGEKAAPTVLEVKADSKHKTTLANGADTTIAFEAKDQYGNKLNAADGDYKVVFSVKDKAEIIALENAVDGKVTVADETNASVKVNSKKEGTAILLAQLVKGDDEVLDSKEITFTVVANESTVGLKIADIPTLYAQKAGTEVAYYEEVKIETADGIALPADSIISVTSSNPAAVAVVDNNKLKGVNTLDGKDNTATITVVYNADDKVVTLEKEVIVSAAVRKADAIKVVDTQQHANTGIVTKLVDDTKAVTTIDVADFAALEGYTDAYAIVEDNFGRFVNAKIGEAVYNDVKVAVTNDDGFATGANKTVTISEDGQLDFSAMKDNLLANDAEKASFRVIITGSGKVATVEVNVAGGKTAAEKAEEDREAAIEVTSVTASNAEGKDKLVIVLSDTPKADLTAMSVEVTREIDNKNDDAFIWNGGSSSWDKENNTLTITGIEPVASTDAEQKVVYSVSYGEHVAKDANELTVS